MAIESDESSSTDEEAEMQIIKKLYLQKGDSGKKPTNNQECVFVRPSNNIFQKFFFNFFSKKSQIFVNIFPKSAF
jgi:hypothetical protein